MTDDRQEIRSYFFQQPGSEVHEYYFLFTNRIQDTNLPLYELASLLEKILDDPPTPKDFGHGENGAWVTLRRPMTHEQLLTVVRLAGYVQYCGPTIIRAPWVEVDERSLHEAIARYLRQAVSADPGDGDTPNAPQPVLLANTVEGFPVDWPYSLPAVVGSRFYRDKYFLSDQPVAVVLRKMDPPATRPSAPWDAPRLKVLDSLEKLTRFDDLERDSSQDPLCLYLFQDFTHRGDGSYPGSGVETQLVLIGSRYSQKNMVHLFDDDKPYWPDRITTPPRLVASAMNLTHTPLPGPSTEGPQDPRFYVFDPFTGTGTTIIEAQKYPVTVIGNDIENPRGVKDNLEFFLGFTPERVKAHIRQVEARLVEERDPFLHDLLAILDGYYAGDTDFCDTLSVNQLLDALSSGSLATGPAGDRLSPREKISLKDATRRFKEAFDTDSGLFEDPAHRYLIYQVYRVLRQRYPDCVFTSNRISPALFNKLHRTQWSREHDPRGTTKGHLRRKLRLLAEQLEKMEAEGGRRTYPLRLRRGVPYLPLQNLPPARLLNRDINKLSRMSLEEVNELLGVPGKEARIDLVLSDLPYSMNKDVAGLASLYEACFKLCARAIRPGGELVLFVLDKVRSGKKVPEDAFTGKVEERLRRCFETEGRELRPKAYPDLFPEDRGRLYWKSKKALNRVILHYHIT